MKLEFFFFFLNIFIVPSLNLFSVSFEFLSLFFFGFAQICLPKQDLALCCCAIFFSGKKFCQNAGNNKSGL